MDPEGVRVTGFKVPTPEELRHNFLWRVHPHAPEKATSPSSTARITKMCWSPRQKLVPKKKWKARYEFINEFEKLLHVDNNTTILKFFLYISKEEQLRRFKHRLDDPERQWKISEADYKEREYWDDYIDAFEDMFANCSKEHAPWFIIPSNNKWFRNLAVAKIIAETLEEMNPKYPPPKVDLDEIRRLYHSAVRDGEENSDTNGKSAKKKNQ